MYHSDLEAWKESINLVKVIYKITEKFPKSELFGLTSQARRAAVSIPSNIAVGNARYSPKESLRFMDIALGSLAELETQLIIAKELNYLESCDDEIKNIKKVNALLKGLRKYFDERSE